MSIENKNFEVRKAVLNKKGHPQMKLVSTNYKNGIYVNDVDNKNRDVLPHDSLVKSFQNLLPHAILVSDIALTKIDESYLTQKKVHNDVKLRGYHCVGFEIKGDNDEQSVKLFVRKSTSLGPVEFKTPFIKTHGNNTGYPFSGLLSEDLDAAIEEVIEYINGKDFNSDQVSIEFPEGEEQTGESEEEETEEEPFG